MPALSTPVRKLTPRRVEPVEEAYLRRILGAGGLLERDMAALGRQFEARPEQLSMALAVSRAIRRRHHLVVEAGTGTGKSYAYLLPFLLWAVEHKKRVLVATGTKALQQQLVDRDLPFLSDLFLRHLGQEIRYSLCLGTANYICPRRLAKAQGSGLFAADNELAQLAQIRDFARESSTGRNIDLPFEARPGLWAQVNRESDLCLGRNCPSFDLSFFYKARREQEKAHILVANHHLLFAHLAAGGNQGGVLPPFDALVIDEAHHAEDVAAAYLGVEFSNLGAARLVELVANRRAGRTLLSSTKWQETPELEKRLHEAAAEVREAIGRFFENLQLALPFDARRSTNIRLPDPHIVEDCVSEPLERIEAVLKDAKRVAERESDDGLARELEGFAGRCAEMRRAVRTALFHAEPNSVYWASCVPRLPEGPGRPARVPRISLHGAPIEVGPAMRRSLFQAFRPVVMTSATMTTGGSFQFLLERLGLGGWPVESEDLPAAQDAAPNTSTPQSLPELVKEAAATPKALDEPQMVQATTPEPAPAPGGPVLTQPAANRGSTPFNGVEIRALEASPEDMAAMVPVKTMVLGSPFNFEANALLYIGQDLPDPITGAYWEEAAVRRAGEVVRRTNGRAFVLCTSYRLVERVSKYLTEYLPGDIRVLRQGEGPRGKLLADFRQDVHSVLVATTSFWQGVDVPGESLSCVVIMKLPFAVPDEPLVAARVESLKNQGRNAFSEYQVPQAVMMFRQGFGRLIRTAQDRGIVAILDPRVRTKPYGSTFLQSLPAVRTTYDLEEITQFWVPKETSQ